MPPPPIAISSTKPAETSQNYSKDESDNLSVSSVTKRIALLNNNSLGSSEIDEVGDYEHLLPSGIYYKFPN